MNYTVINYPLLVSDPSSPYLDKRSYVEYYDDLWNIQNPHVNLKVFCKETDTEYRITAVDPIIVNDALIGNKVSEFEEVPRHASVGINYRGVFNGNPPEDPVNGDWYRNDVEGKTYIYQGDASNGGEWIMMSKDGTNGKDGIDGKDGVDGGSVEYIYARTLYNEFPNEYFTPTEWVESDGYQQYDFVPDVKDGYNKPVWTDAPVGVDSLYKYEWTSSRKLRLDEDSESMVWSQFSTPTLWNYFVQDGLNLNLTLSQDNIIVIVDNDGVELDEDKRGTSTLGIYLGSKSIDATECDVDLESSIRYVVPQFDADNSKITFDLPYSVSVFPEVTQITVTVTYIENDVTYTAVKVLTITRIVSPSYDYEFYELNPSDSIVKRDTYGVETPSTVSATVYKYDTTGRKEITTTEVKSAGLTTKYTLDDSSTLHNYDAGDEISCDTFNNNITFYLYQTIDGVQTQIDKEVIELVADGISAEIPDWVNEWDGTVAQFNGENMLAVKAYVGDKPSDQPWTGLLIGSNVSSIKNSPWATGDTPYDFSGILAISGEDTNAGNNDFNNVTFALNSKNGDAYFKGVVIAGEIETSVINNCSVSDFSISDSLTVSKNITIGGFVKRSWKQITWTREEAEYNNNNAFNFLNKLDKEGASFVIVTTDDNNPDINLPSFESQDDPENQVFPNYNDLVNLLQYLGSTIVIQNGNTDGKSINVVADTIYKIENTDTKKGYLVLRCEFYFNNGIETLGWVGNLFSPTGIPLENLYVQPTYFQERVAGPDGSATTLQASVYGIPDNSTQLTDVRWGISNNTCGATINEKTGVVTIQPGSLGKYAQKVNELPG